MMSLWSDVLGTMYYNPNDLLIAGNSLLILYILYDTMDDYLFHTDF